MRREVQCSRGLGTVVPCWDVGSSAAKSIAQTNNKATCTRSTARVIHAEAYRATNTVRPIRATWSRKTEPSWRHPAVHRRKARRRRSAAPKTEPDRGYNAVPLRGRLMVGRLTLDQVVKVRVLAPQLQERLALAEPLGESGCSDDAQGVGRDYVRWHARLRVG